MQFSLAKTSLVCHGLQHEGLLHTKWSNCRIPFRRPMGMLCRNHAYVKRWACCNFLLKWNCPYPLVSLLAVHIQQSVFGSTLTLSKNLCIVLVERFEIVRYLKSAILILLNDVWLELGGVLAPLTLDYYTITKRIVKQ